MTDIFIICNLLQQFINYLEERSNEIVSLQDPDILFKITPEMVEIIKAEDQYFPTKKEMKLPQKANGFSAPKLKGRKHSHHN